LVRVEEMRESIKIIFQTINLIKEGPINFFNYQLKHNKNNFKYDMEKLILHFKHFSTGLFVKKGSCYKSVESPKGEFGVYLKSIGFNKPYRCKIRSTGFFNLQNLVKIKKKGSCYKSVESKKGEFGVYLKYIGFKNL
jgi:NADH-quinone oxidoreductase subunit D